MYLSPVVVEKSIFANCMVSVDPPSTMLSVADQIVANPNSYAPIIDAAVLEEAAVFDGHHCLDQVWWNLVVGDQPALGAVGVSLRPVISSGSSS